MAELPATYVRQLWWGALILGAAGAWAFVTSTHEVFDSPDLNRWGRAPAASDLPRTWFDAHVGPLGEEKKCFIRQDHREGDKAVVWVVDKYLAPETIPLEAEGRHYDVSLDDLEAFGRTLPDSESLQYDPAIYSDKLRFVEVCVAAGAHVTVDGCVDGDRLRRCSPGELAGILRPPGTLREQREARIWKASRAIWGTLPGPLAFLLIVWAWDVGFPFAKRVRARPSVRRGIRRNMLVAAAASLVAPVVGLVTHGGVASISLALVPVLVVPFLFWRARAIRSILRDLRAPPRGSVALEGRVADDTPLGKRALAAEPVALSLVEVEREVRGSKGEVTGHYAVGEVQDVGELRVTGPFGRATIPVDDAIIEIDVDTEVVVKGSEIPPEIAASVAVDRDERYRLREHCLKPGDQVAVLVEGDLQPAVEGNAYRAAPAGLNLAGGAHPVIFEGTKADALRRFGRHALALEALVVLFFAVGIGACAWGIVIARTLR